MYRAGFRKAISDEAGNVIGWEYFIFLDTFRNEICTGSDYLALLKLLKMRGALVVDKTRSYDCKPRLPGEGHKWCYCILSSVLDEFDSD
jgi:putative DNA primase/helicase